MTTLLKATAVLATLLAALPVAALAGDTGGGFVAILFTGGDVHGGHRVNSEIDVTGSITVDFHGDQASGCAAAHLCGVVGSVRFNAAGPGSIVAIGYREHGKRFEDGFMAYAEEFRPDFLPTTARVRRTAAPGSLCADAVPLEVVSSGGPPRRGSSVVLRLLDRPSDGLAPSEVLRTRCAGPTAGDVAALLPGRRVNERQLLRGHTRLDFSADRSFAAHGLAGTLHSDVVVRIVGGRRIALNPGLGGYPRGSRKVRKRTLTAEYRVERVSGQVTTSIRGRGDSDLCGPLDACGILGSVTASPTATSGTAAISATASARRSASDLQRSLGLIPGRRPSRVERNGDAFWRRDGGSVTSELTRDGAPACSDSIPIGGGGAIQLSFSRGRVRASYGTEGFGVTGLVQTRCPGPVQLDAPAALATGTFPVSVFRHRRVTLRLTRGAGYGASGYSGRTRPDITVVLRRVRIRSSTFTEVIPRDFPGGSQVRSLR